MDHPLFPLGNASGGGPQFGGHFPTVSEALGRAEMGAAHLQLMQRAALLDPRGNRFTSMVGNAFFSDPYTMGRYMQTPEAMALRQGVGMAGAMGFLGGGSMYDLGFGLQQFAGNQSMRMGIEGVPGSQQFAGQGFITDQFASQMMAKLASEMFTGGQANFQARGMNLTDMGVILNAGAARGVFAGQTLMDQSVYTGATIAADLATATERGDLLEMEKLGKARPGDLRIRMRDEGEKVKKFVQDTGELLGEMRDLYGDLPIEELIQKAEMITGTGLEDLGGPASIRNRIQNIRASAVGGGMNPQVVMELAARGGQTAAMQLSAMFGGSPELYNGIAYDIGTGAALDMVTARSTGNITSAALREQGVYAPRFGDSYRQAMSMQANMALMGEEFQVVEAYYAASRSGTSAGDKQALMDAAAEVSALAPDDPRRVGAMAKLEGAMSAAGFNSGELYQRFGGDTAAMANRIDPATRQSMRQSLMAQERARALNPNGQLAEIVDAMNPGVRFAALTQRAGGADGLTGVFAQLYGAYGYGDENTTIGRILAAGGDQAAIAKILAENPEASAGLDASAIARLGDFSGAYREFSQQIAGDPRFANIGSAEQDTMNARAAYVETAKSYAMGTARGRQKGFVETALNALFGIGEGPSEGAITAYAFDKMKGGSFGLLGKEGAYRMQLDADQAGDLVQQLTGGDPKLQERLMNQLGVSNMGELAESLNTTAGFRELHKFTLQESGVHANLARNRLRVITPEQFDQAQKDLNTEAGAAFFKSAGLGDLDQDLKDRIMGGEMHLLGQQLISDKNVLNAKGQNLIKNLADPSKAQDSLRVLKALGGTGSEAVIAGLDQAEEALMKKYKGTSGEERQVMDRTLLNIKQLRQELGGPAGGGIQKVFVTNMPGEGGTDALPETG